LVVYFFVLPGAAGVQSNVGASTALVLFVVARLGAIFAELLRLFEPAQGVLAGVAWFSSAIVIASIAVTVIGRWRRREAFSTLETFSLGLFVFGFAANAL